MILLDETDKSLEVLLAGAVTTNQLEWTISVVDLQQSSMQLADAWSDDGVTAGATPVEIVPAPSSGFIRQVKYVNVFNADTVAATVSVRVNNGGSVRRQESAELQPGESLRFVG